ncbi:MAG TPA: hypothetical protein VI818_04010 [Candidatus Thermoplasmatota archaeon]|nr:hypothetical protein [Candidatus Thermoplasmatota archaeon]
MGWITANLGLAVAIVMMGAPLAAAGGPSEPEVTDPASDAALEHIDIVKAWIEPVGGSFEAHVQMRGPVPTQPCPQAAPLTYVFLRYGLEGPLFELASPGVETYELRATAACNGGLLTWRFRMETREPGTCENCFSGSGTLSAEIRGGHFVFKPTAASHGLGEGDGYTVKSLYAFARQYQGLPTGIPVVGVPVFAEDRAPNTGHGKVFPNNANLSLRSSAGAPLREGDVPDRFVASLGKQPAGPVVFTVRSLNPAQLVAEPAQLSFTPENWHQPQELMVGAVNDTRVEGTHPGGFVVCVDPAATSDDYDLAAGRLVNVTILDDDSPVDTNATRAQGPPTVDVVHCDPTSLEDAKSALKAHEAKAVEAAGVKAGESPGPLFVSVLVALVAALLAWGRRD